MEMENLCITLRRFLGGITRRWRGISRCLYIQMEIPTHSTRRRGSWRGSMRARVISFRISERVGFGRTIPIALISSLFPSLVTRWEGRYDMIWYDNDCKLLLFLANEFLFVCELWWCEDLKLWHSGIEKWFDDTLHLHLYRNRTKFYFKLSNVIHLYTWTGKIMFTSVEPQVAKCSLVNGLILPWNFMVIYDNAG